MTVLATMRDTALPEGMVASALPNREAKIIAANISAGYNGSGPTIRNVSVSFPANSVTAILGPSGCGKSTFLGTLNRTLELTPGADIMSGGIYYDGVNIYGADIDPRMVRSTIGMIYQKPVPFPMSIEDNVLFGVRFHHPMNRSRQRDLVEYNLRQVGLWDEVCDRLKSSAHALSGGQQQRLCLARTLANGPDVILMDEPCSSLDPASTARIEALILDLKSTCTLIVVTHNLAQARRIADYAMVMVDGNVVERGAATIVLENPKHPKAQDFVRGRIG